MYILVVRGRNSADIRSANDAMWKQLGEQGVRLFKEGLSLLRRRDTRDGWHRPKLSFPEYR
jgi:hypothetical protein